MTLPCCRGVPGLQFTSAFSLLIHERALDELNRFFYL